jgi:DNA-nicking Smr family endonuclease
MPRDRNGRRGLTDDERVLWTTVTRSIAPLRDVPEVAPDAPGNNKETPRPAAKSPRPASGTAAPAAPQKVAVPPAPSPLGRRKRGRVARGKDHIDGRLDLHGLTQGEAHGALLRFLRAASARGARLVLVITGKGGGDGERGVLRRQLPHWLALPEFSALVIGFEQAHIAHGGEGAWYISVRRSRTAE